MDFSAAIVNGLLTIVGYVVIFLGVYKVYHIATDIREIKDMIANAHRNPLIAASLTPTIAPVGKSKDVFTNGGDLLADDSADAYAEQLLRTVDPGSQVKQNEPHEVH